MINRATTAIAMTIGNHGINCGPSGGTVAGNSVLSSVTDVEGNNVECNNVDVSLSGTLGGNVKRVPKVRGGTTVVVAVEPLMMTVWPVTVGGAGVGNGVGANV